MRLAANAHVCFSQVDGAKTSTNPKCAALAEQVREEAAIATAAFRAAEMWLKLKSPSVSDGNNFGVDVQNYVISELVAMRTQMDAFIIASRDYHYSRAEGVGKLFAGNKSDESTSESSEVADGKVETETAAITPTHTLMHTNPRFCSSLPLAFRSFRSHRPRRRRRRRPRRTLRRRPGRPTTSRTSSAWTSRRTTPHSTGDCQHAHAWTCVLRLCVCVCVCVCVCDASRPLASRAARFTAPTRDLVHSPLARCVCSA